MADLVSRVDDRLDTADEPDPHPPIEQQRQLVSHSPLAIEHGCVFQNGIEIHLDDSRNDSQLVHL